MGALDHDFAARFDRQQRLRAQRDRVEILQAEYDDRERARVEARRLSCSGCGLRHSHWPGCPSIGTDDRPTLRER